MKEAIPRRDGVSEKSKCLTFLGFKQFKELIQLR